MIGYLAAYLLVPLFGLSLAWKIEDRVARAGFAFLAGAFLLTVEATLFSIIGVRWTAWTLAVPLLVASVIYRKAAADRRRTPKRGFAALIVGIASAHFALMCATTQSVSADYLLFWGAKSIRFAAARAIDPDLLKWVWFLHGQREYPPLVPVFQAWGTLVSGQFPWITAAALSAIWLVAAAAVISSLLDNAAAFWAAAMANSLAWSLSGGNAEAMLIAYLSVAAVAIVVDSYGIASIALAGALLTKEEAVISVVALVAATIVRDLFRRHFDRRILLLILLPAASLGLWFFYQWRWGLAVGYRRYASYVVLHFENSRIIALEMLKKLEAGSWWLAWIIPLILLIVAAIRTPRRLVAVLPLLLPIPLLFAFFFYVYLQQSIEIVAIRIGWTLPRIAQPAMAFLILAAAFATSPGRATVRGDLKIESVRSGSEVD